MPVSEQKAKVIDVYNLLLRVRARDCCLTPTQQFFSYMYIIARTS
jgi:hypothetical protein